MSSTSSPAKVLIVDDKDENLRALDAVIRSEEREIFQTNSGEKALEFLLQHEFALAIIDVQMPGMDGFELAELMRGAERTRDIPIVFVSAAGREMKYAFKGYESGAVDFLHKPLDIKAVQSKVNVFVSLYRQRQETQRQVEALKKSRAEQQALLEELQRTQGELERAVHMRDDFMSMVAHEMRTPLNTLFLAAQLRSIKLAQGKMEFFAPESLRGMVAHDSRQVQGMVRLIDDMLDISRIRSGQLSIRPQPVKFAPLLRRVIDDLTPQASAAGIEITSSDLPDIQGHWDEFRIEQVLVNLLTNAIRYGRSPVTIRAAFDGENVLIEIADSGPGISKAAQARIFEPFERGGNKDRSGGLGLGLHITRQLVQSHGGTIGLESSEGAGTTFIVSLPLNAPA